MTTKPPSTTTPPTKPHTKIHPSATISDKASVTGPHTLEIHPDALIHPHAKLKAEHGNLVIGRGSIVSEKAVVGVSEAPPTDSDAGDEGTADLVIGEGVNIASGAVIEARRLGDHSTIGINARVGQGAVVGRWCTVGPMCVVRADEVLEDFTVVFGDGEKGRRVDGVGRDRKEVREARMKGMEMEGEALKGVIVDGKMKWMS